MTKVHMTPAGPRPCRASKRPCKYGEHYATEAEGLEAFQKQQAVSTVAAPLKKAPTTPPAEKVFNSKQDLSEVFVGQRVVGMELGEREDQVVLTLGNGSRVEVTGNEGCGGCPRGHYSLQQLADLSEVDNVITKVEVVDESDSIDRATEGFAAERYSLFVFAEHKKIALAQFQAEEDNGYYGEPFYLTVTPAS